MGSVMETYRKQGNLTLYNIPPKEINNPMLTATILNQVGESDQMEHCSEQLFCSAISLPAYGEVAEPGAFIRGRPRT